MRFFSSLVQQTLSRSKESTLSVLGITNPALREHLGNQMEAECGKEGSFLAPPLFEHTFGWQPAEPKIEDLKGSLLSKSVVDALDSKENGRYRFAAHFNPFKHQLESWQTLLDKSKKSVVVTSGTGSGKTECFMVPVLEDLYQELAQKQEKLVGVRAIFLYPLNALINSQRERLSAWTQSFDDGMRFCLYNGNTVDKENLKRSEQKKTLNEILTRQLMRREPAPILVTNGTMLEYMLVRNIDAPIVEISKKEQSLRWIILDEAHTYVGSQAAELSMQLRRVLQAFGVEAKNVRFVATSATIADENAEEQLQKYLSDLAGVDLKQVVVIGGNRKVPTISELENENISLEDLCKIPANEVKKPKDFDLDVSKARFESLCKSNLAKTIRTILTESNTPLTIEQISNQVFSKTDIKLSQDELLRWIDLLTGTKPDLNSEAFLKVRSHFFQSMINGLWSCIDKECSAKKETPLRDKWPFGNVYVKHKHKCECGAPVLEISHCNDCNEPHLLGLDKNGVLTQRNLEVNDEFSLNQEFNTEDSDDEEELDVRTSKHCIVIASSRKNDEKYHEVGINKESGRIGGFNEDVNLLIDESNKAECGACSYKGFNKNSPFRRAILGSPFYVSNAVPTLLEYCPDAEFDKETNIGPESLPGRGRKLITFTDSRQGTARMAVRMQQEAERNKLRGLVFEILKNEQLRKGAFLSVEEIDETELQKLRDTAETLRAIMPNEAAKVDDKIKEILAAKDGGSIFNSVALTWTEMVTELAQHSDVHSSILQYNQYANPELFNDNSGAHTLADMLLVREFARRPKRQNSLETQGIVKISYQGIDKVTTTPPLWESKGLNLNDWRDFIKVCLDFYVRENTFIQLEDNLRAWIGFRFSPKKLMKPDPTGISSGDNRVKRWPQVKKNMANRLGKLLALGGGLKLNDQTDVDIINDWLFSVWNAITSKANPILKSEGNQYYLTRNNLTLSFIDKGYLCPVTNKILDTTFKGLTPYLPRDITKGSFQCEEVAYPSLWNFDVSQEEYQEGVTKVREQLKLNDDVEKLRSMNVWTDINDRTVEGGFYYRTAEHSAQQSAERLQAYEAMFKKGTVNVLNCSTTMEMGVDIGGISAVVMNNVPPHPANYLQRSGRAGRSKESRAISYTLCKNNPHDTQVFNNPAWPFVTKIPAPQISLNSERLVQRHVNSFLLSVYLKEEIGTTQKEKTSLNLQWFFEDDSQSTCERFKGWLGQQSPEQKQNVMSLVRGTALDAMQVESIIENTNNAISKLENDWLYTFKRLIAQLGKAETDSPFEFRIRQELARHRKEYLLKELAAKTFLPGYGFPTDVVSLNNFNLTDYKREKDKEANDKFGREDNISQLRGMPTRNLSVAIREYAPGAELVIDGRVFKSSGISLNWQKIGVANAKEEQKFDTAWRCDNCGDSGLSVGVLGSDELKCHSCDELIKPQFQLKVLEPTGFVTDFFDEPSNDISTQKYIPVQPAWVSVAGDSHPLPNPETGFMCYGNNGTIFHHSSGEHGHGYAVCLTCGRADSMISDDEFPKDLTPNEPHRPVVSMPGTKGSEKYKEQCEGSSFIQSGIHLGCSSFTDVFEITLRDPETNTYIPDSPEGRTVATTLAVALRNALSEQLGVSTGEMGYTIRPSKITGSGNSAMVIQLYDIVSGGAGFSTSAPHYISTLLKSAYDTLNCIEKCDDVCSSCLLDSSTRHDSQFLNRNVAKEWLGLSFKNDISLPEQYQYMEGAQYCHASVKEVIAQQINKGAKSVTLWLGSDSNEWDLNSRRVRTLVHQYISVQEIDLTFVLPSIELDDETKNELLRYKSWGVALVKCDEQCSNDGVFVAQIISDKEITSIAASSTELIAVNHNWLLSTSEIVVVKSDKFEKVKLLIFDTRDWEKVEASLVSELELSTELNGRITDFGKRFWESAKDSNEALAYAMTTSKVMRVHYSDRYLQSPWYLIIIGEILNSLPTHSNSTIQLDTVFNESARNSGYINNDWQHIDDMEKLYSLWFKLGLTVDLTLNLHSNRFEIPHRRLMVIEFENGDFFKVKSDQGVGYWSLQTPERGHYLKFLDFNLPVEEQCAKIFEVREKCLVRNSADWPTDFVISKV